MAMPKTIAPIVVTLKFRSANRLIGMIGCVALRSTKTNATAPNKAAAANPMICGLSHSYWWPPQVETSTTAVVVDESNAIPR